MYDPPAYLWAITTAGPAAIPAATCIVLYGGAKRAGLGRRRAALLAAGRSNQRITHDLVVALDTVKKHVTHVLGKLGAANRTEAAARARQLGLIP